MPVGANTYGSVVAVERLVGDLVASRDFTTSSTPSEAQIELTLDDVAANLNRELDVSGFVVPVAASDSQAYNYLVSVNNYGAAATVLGMLPPESFDPDAPDVATSRAGMYQSRFNKALEYIAAHRIRATRRRTRLYHVFSGSQEDSDSNRKKPLFTRGVTDFPSSRTLTE